MIIAKPSSSHKIAAPISGENSNTIPANKLINAENTAQPLRSKYFNEAKVTIASTIQVIPTNKPTIKNR